MRGRAILRISLLTAVTAALAFSAVSCGGGTGESDETEAAAPPVPTSTTDPECGVVPPALLGTYTRETNADELPPEVADIQVGTWERTIGPEHRLITRAPQGNVIDLSPVCVSDNRLSVAEEAAGGSCAGYGPGFYEWELRGRDLVFTKIADRCADRAYVWTSAPWTRKASP